jgi:plasmid maintenance system antidote protein VapI
MGALLAMGWTFAGAARVLGVHPNTVRRLVAGEGERPGLAARLEAFLNGREEVP